MSVIPGPAALVRLWYHAEMQGPTSTLIAVGYNDVAKDVISKLKATLEKRRMPKPETEMKSLRVLILSGVGGRGSLFYPLPVTATIYSGGQNSDSRPVSPNGPILITAALCDYICLKKDNPEWADDVQPLRIPKVMETTIIASLSTLNDPNVNIIRSTNSRQGSPNRITDKHDSDEMDRNRKSLPTAPPSPIHKQTGETKTSPDTPPEGKRGDVMSPSVSSLVTQSPPVPVLHYGAIEGICEVTYRLPHDIIVNTPSNDGYTVMGDLSPYRSASVNNDSRRSSPIRVIGNRGSPKRSHNNISPHNATNSPVVISTVTVAVKYLRGDTAEDVLRSALLKMRIEHKATVPASYFPTNVSCLMLCTADDNSNNNTDVYDSNAMIGFETFSQKDCMPIYTNERVGNVSTSNTDTQWNTIKMRMIDLGDRYLPRSATSEECNISDRFASPIKSHGVSLTKDSINNVVSVDYVNRSARLKKLTDQITTETNNATELEKEHKELSRIAIEEQERKDACEAQRLEVMAAKRDIDRLSGLKQWFTKELADRQEMEKEQLRIHVLGGGGGESEWERQNGSFRNDYHTIVTA